jgi:hypothetical protein
MRPRSDKRDVDLISDVLPFGRLWYAEPNAINNAIGYAKFFSRSHDAVIRVFDEVGKVRLARAHPLKFGFNCGESVSC